MKTLVYLLPILLLLLPARADDADNLIQNGDFVDGLTHWYGNGHSPADYANDNPLQASDPFTSKGMIVPLHPMWVKVAQDFKGKSASGELIVTYKVSPDFAFSTDPEDYVNMPDKVGYDRWKAFNTPPGTWVVFLADFGTDHGTYWEITPKPGTKEPQSFRANISSMTPFSDKTITFAFPPGKGMIVILNVSLVSH